jgi:hypothetical protein
LITIALSFCLAIHPSYLCRSPMHDVISFHYTPSTPQGAESLTLQREYNSPFFEQGFENDPGHLRVFLETSCTIAEPLLAERNIDTHAVASIKNRFS